MTLASHLDNASAARVSTLIWGSPGVGKSAAIRHWAASRNLPCWTIIASLREPADFGHAIHGGRDDAPARASLPGQRPAVDIQTLTVS
ncbi:MAG: hypothetical protein EB058_15205 [Proteobacteria bacterium]|nr:hypothetical protein [Pseudomonadota bacterium]